MNFNATLIFQSIAFLLFVAFTWKFVWPPILKAMNERQSRIADGLAAADKGARALQDASTKSEEALHAARAQAPDILAAANKQASQIVEKGKNTAQRSEEHTSELQSLMRISYAVFCLKQKTTTNQLDLHST